MLNGTETTIFQDHQVNDMDADDLAPCVARSSATMVLNLQYEQVIVFHKEWFQPLVPFWCKEMIKKYQIYIILRKINST